jgi:hypothetical protein
VLAARPCIARFPFRPRLEESALIIKIVIAALFVACVLYIHFRGKVRARWSRQLLDHSSFMAPINVVMYMFSKVPTTPFLDPAKEFPAGAAAPELADDPR